MEIDILTKQINTNTILAIKKIEINEISLRNNCLLSDVDEFILQNATSIQRRLEILNVRALINQLGIKTEITYKNRKPIASNGYISISHTDKFVAIIWSNTKQYGIDIEELDKRIIRIAKRAFNEKELKIANNNPIILNYLWNAKECIYKLSPTRGLNFKNQILLESFINDQNAIFKLELSGKTEYYNIFFDKFNDHTLAYAIKRL